MVDNKILKVVKIKGGISPGMPVTFQGNVIGEVIRSDGDNVLMAINGTHMKSMIKDCSFSLEVRKK